MYNYHIIVDGVLREENNFCFVVDLPEVIAAQIYAILGESTEFRKIEVLITKDK